MAIMPLLNLGVAELITALQATTTTISPTYALPARLHSLSVQYFFATNPSALTLNVQLSNDGSNFFTASSTQVTTGGIVSITGVAANFMRLNIGAITAGAQLTSYVTAKA